MKHARVELSFQITTTDCDITVWIATDNVLAFSKAAPKYYKKADELRAAIVELTHEPMDILVMWLEDDPRVARFAVSARHDYKNVTVHVDRA